MTDIIDTGEIARRIPASVTARIYQPDPPTEVIPGVPALPFYADLHAQLHPGEGPLIDLRPARPAHLGDVHRYLPGALDDRPYPPVPPPTPPQPKPSLADDLLGDGDLPPFPPPPPLPKPTWAQSGSAGEWPVVRPAAPRARTESDPGRHRAAAPRWARRTLQVGAVLALTCLPTFIGWAVWFR